MFWLHRRASPANRNESQSAELETRKVQRRTDRSNERTNPSPTQLQQPQMIRATTSSYRAFRAMVKEGQSAELSNVPRIFATKQTTILKTQQVLNSMPKLMSEIEELYNTLETHIK